MDDPKKMRAKTLSSSRRFARTSFPEAPLSVGIAGAIILLGECFERETARRLVAVTLDAETYDILDSQLRKVAERGGPGPVVVAGIRVLRAS